MLIAVSGIELLRVRSRWLMAVRMLEERRSQMRLCRFGAGPVRIPIEQSDEGGE